MCSAERRHTLWSSWAAAGLCPGGDGGSQVMDSQLHGRQPHAPSTPGGLRCATKSPPPLLYHFSPSLSTNTTRPGQVSSGKVRVRWRPSDSAVCTALSPAWLVPGGQQSCSQAAAKHAGNTAGRPKATGASAGGCTRQQAAPNAACPDGAPHAGYSSAGSQTAAAGPSGAGQKPQPLLPPAPAAQPCRPAAHLRRQRPVVDRPVQHQLGPRLVAGNLNAVRHCGTGCALLRALHHVHGDAGVVEAGGRQHLLLGRRHRSGRRRHGVADQGAAALAACEGARAARGWAHAGNGGKCAGPGEPGRKVGSPIRPAACAGLKRLAAGAATEGRRGRQGVSQSPPPSLSTNADDRRPGPIHSGGSQPLATRGWGGP